MYNTFKVIIGSYLIKQTTKLMDGEQVWKNSSLMEEKGD
jgi:hypothetical protein